MALLKNFGPRSNRDDNEKAIKRSASKKSSSAPIRSGGGIHETVATLEGVVNKELGRYADEYLLIRDNAALEKYVDILIEKGIYALDTETTSLDTMTTTIAGVCLHTDGIKPCYIPINHVSYVTGVRIAQQVTEDEMRTQLQRLVDSDAKCIMHHAKFDIRVLQHTLGIYVPCFWDTKLAANCLNENESSSLKDIHLKYVGSEDRIAFTYDKLFRNIPFTIVPLKTAYLYAAGDAIKTFDMYKFQKHYMDMDRLKGVYNVFRNIEMRVLNAVIAMEDEGIALNYETAERLEKEYLEKREEAEEVIRDVLSQYEEAIRMYKETTPDHKLSDDINLDSPAQVAVLLYDIIGVQSKDKDKPRGTGEDILKKIDIPLTRALLEYRGIQKLLSTYILKIPQMVGKTGKIHCSFNQYGAATGRFSSSDPNMQNIPSKNKEIRRMFRADDGNVLLSCDFSQQEPRILADRSGDEHLIQAYKENKDIYAWIGAKIYKVPYEDCLEFRPDGTKSAEGAKRRNSVKSIILGIMYGRGTRSIAEQLSCTTREAQDIIDTFYTEFPSVKNWMTSTIATAKETGYVETAWGRRRRLQDIKLSPYEFSYMDKEDDNFNPLDFGSGQVEERQVPIAVCRQYVDKLENQWSWSAKQTVLQEARRNGILIKDNTGFIADAERQCINSVIQGSSADVTKLAMVAVHENERLKELGCKLLLQVHDEIILQCPEQNRHECAELVCDLMIQAATEKISVPMKVDAEATYVWYGESISLGE